MLSPFASQDAPQSSDGKTLGDHSEDPGDFISMPRLISARQIRQMGGPSVSSAVWPASGAADLASDSVAGAADSAAGLAVNPND